MSLYTKKFEKIKNIQPYRIKKDFKFSSISFFIYAIAITVGVIIELNNSNPLYTQPLILFSLVLIIIASLIAIVPSWMNVINMILISWLVMIGVFGGLFINLALSATIGLIIASSVQLILQWDNVVILRLGKFKKVHGPGLTLLFPLIDRIAESIDTRIRVTDFSAEKTLTTDTVPVHVDALAFWMVWDAKSVVLEVENYIEAVILSAQTALRDAIGKHELSNLLSDREELGKEIQLALDAKTTPWGVTILSIEITDIIIPKELENAMSKRAQAEREKQSRIILAEAEVSIAKKFTQAASEYDNHPNAMQLRSMNMIYEGIRQNNSMMLMPSGMIDSLNIGTALSGAALQQIQELKNKKEKVDDSNTEC